MPLMNVTFQHNLLQFYCIFCSFSENEQFNWAKFYLNPYDAQTDEEKKLMGKKAAAKGFFSFLIYNMLCNIVHIFCG